MTTHMLNEAKFSLFLNEELSVKESKVMLEQVQQRILYIIEKMMSAYGFSTDWADIDVEDHEMYDDDEILFDVSEHALEVPFVGSFIPNANCKIKIYEISRIFPTSWLYQDFEEELNKRIAADMENFQKKEDEKNKAIQEVADNEKELADAKEKILKILPKELLQYISFVSASQLSSHKASLRKQQGVMIAKKIKELKNSSVDVSQKFDEYRSQGGTQIFIDWLEKNYS